MSRDRADAPSGTGDCYVVAGHAIMDPTERTHRVLCHGTVIGTGLLDGIAFGHAWIEVEVGAGHWFVIDESNGHHYVGPRDQYYAAGQVSDVVRYERNAALVRLARERTFGPWETDDG